MTALADELLAEVAEHLAADRTRVAVLGLTPEGLTVATVASSLGGDTMLFDLDAPADQHQLLRPWPELAESSPDVVVIAADRRKERLLRAAAERV